ncbi:MAG: hypothetical protein ABI206_04670, partial [Antricoccus sp.]
MRTPAVILAVIAATAILACAAASASLFVSSASSAALQLSMRQFCNSSSLPQIAGVRNFNILPDGRYLTPEQNAAIISKVAGPDYRSVDQINQLTTAMVSAGLAAPLTTAQSGIQFADYPQLQGALLYKSDALNHVDIIEKANVQGIYLPDDLAAILGAHAGSPITRTSSPPIMVAGIYKSIARAPVSPFWCQDRQIFKLNPGSDKAPPYLILATNLDLLSDRSDPGDLGPTFYLTSPVNISSSALSDAHKWQAKLRIAIDSVSASKYPFNGITAGGDLNDTIRDVSLIRRGLIGPIAPIAIGGSLLALFLVAAAG